jgi:hypothetical protein
METFLAMQHCTNSELTRLNLCCMHLQIEFLSEMCTPKGDCILPEVWKGIRPNESKSAMFWPRQARRFEKSWSLWREAIKLAYLGPEVLRAAKARTNLPLNVPLGPWIGERHRSQRLWNSCISYDSHILYRLRVVGYRLHKPLTGTFRHRRFNVDYFSACSDLSSVPCLVPVSV